MQARLLYIKFSFRIQTLGNTVCHSIRLVIHEVAEK